MSNRAEETRREKLGFQFVAAFDDGDLDALAVLWKEAESDAELGRLLCELTDSMSEEDVEPHGSPKDDRRLRAESGGSPSEATIERAAPGCLPHSEGHGTLVLSRKLGERVQINHDITVTVVRIERDQVRLQFSAPKYIPIHRQEISGAMGRNPAPLEEDLTFSGD